MGVQEYDYIAVGWAIMLVFLTLFWYATLRKLMPLLKERLASTQAKGSITGLPSVFVFIFRGDFKVAGDQRLTTLCKRLRQLLYGYLGAIGAYIVFLVIMRPPA